MGPRNGARASAEDKDYVCVIEYRKRLGLPTHFNAEQYRDVSKAWKEQALKNGVGLAAREPDSASAPHRRTWTRSC